MQVELVVVENEGSRKLAGIIGRRDILSLYQDRLRQRGN
jgi:CBS domain-containing protein